MAKLTFPSSTVSAYRKGISEFRTSLAKIASWCEKSPGAIVDVASTLAVLTAKLGVTLPAAGTPGQPTSAAAVVNGTGGVVFPFVAGANSASFQYRKSTDGATGVAFAAWTALPSNRALTGQTAGAAVFQLRGVNAAALVGVQSANTAAITIL